MTDAQQTAGVAITTPAESPWAIRMRDVVVTYPNGHTALNGVTLDIAPGEMVSVVGLSGSGKSSLIRTINGLVPISSGTLTVGDYELAHPTNRDLRRLRGQVGMIFQNFNLAGRTSVLNNVLVGRLAHTPTWRTLLGWYPAAGKQIAYDALERVGILGKVWDRASSLSGGQQQRVAIARALSQRPNLILADEPVASLDPPTAHAVMHDLRRINRELDITVITNLHLIDLARNYGTRLIGLRAGEVVYDGQAASASDRDFETIYGRTIEPEDVLGS